MTITKKIGFLGAGQMASALAAGFIRSGITDKKNLCACDINSSALAQFTQKTGAIVHSSITEVITNSDVIFIAVKPQQILPIIKEIKNALADKIADRLFVSIAAGIPIAFYENELGSDLRIIRVMPNTPCLVGEAASGFARSQNAGTEDAELVRELLQTVGIAYEMPEKLLNAVTGLSGSGPAFVFIMLEALADGGVKMGLPRKIALDLAAQTLKGSAEMFLKTGEHPGSLKDRVTSPAGTTIAGVDVLEQRGVRGALIAAVEAATKRSEELGNR